MTRPVPPRPSSLSARARGLLSEAAVPAGVDAAHAFSDAAVHAADTDAFALAVSRLADIIPAADLAAPLIADPSSIQVFGALLGGSEFATDRMVRDPDIFRHLFAEGGWRRRLDADAVFFEAVRAAENVTDEASLKKILRTIKGREMTRIAARDLAGVAPLFEVTGDLSALASASLEAAVRFGRRTLDARYGFPLVEGTDRAAGFVVMAMGKYGAHELNFSSDIDLIYLYETDRGETVGGMEASVSMRQYFVRLAESVTRMISEPTEDGFVFRVDLRLRPEGSKGDIATSLRGAEIYYEGFGQAWERAALIKARPVAGDLPVGEEFISIVRPFVYRKSLDFTNIDEIKRMKEKIDLQAMRSQKGGRDVKLGEGGIREIEFFAQAQQLIYGGRTPQLRVRGTFDALDALVDFGVVPVEERDALKEAYTFLRTVEHRIQIWQERQTHTLPTKIDEQTRIARSIGLASASALMAELDRRTGVVASIHDRLFGGQQAESLGDVPGDIRALLVHHDGEDDLEPRLAALGFRDPASARDGIAVLRDGPPHTNLSARARRYLEKVAPFILSKVVESPNPDAALLNVDRFLAAAGGRTMLYALLYENPKVVELLVHLFGTSPFLSGHLMRHPESIDTFLRKDLSVLSKSKSDFRRELTDFLSTCDGLEAEMDELRRYKNLETLRVGMHESAGNLSLDEGMAQLSALAEVSLQAALGLARREVERRHGQPIVGEGPEEGKRASFCVIGMGKLGSAELSYHSDLDIIFIYSGIGETEPAEGHDPADFRRLGNHEFFARVAQRLISILTTATREGFVFKLDTRLRPSGNAGQLVTSLSSFVRYHDESAALWERQALIKARFVGGDRDFGKTVEREIERFAYERPLPEGAASEIDRLRMRMEVELGKERGAKKNVKVGRGGVVDVEFATQYLQLLHGDKSPSVRSRSTLAALYELRRAGIITEEDHVALDEGYRFLRAIEVRLRLSHDQSVESFDLATLRAEERERYEGETERIRAVYRRLLGLPEEV